MRRRMSGAAIVMFVLAVAGSAKGQSKPDESARLRETANQLAEILRRTDQLAADGLTSTSGSAAIDQVVATELLVISKRYDCMPAYFFFDDTREPKGNGYWCPRNPRVKPLSPFLQRQFGREIEALDPRTSRIKIGMMALGKKLVSSYFKALSKTETPGRNSLLHALLAHELGHMLQFQRRTQLSCPQQELLSDVLAGWSTRYEKQHGRPEIDEWVVFRNFYDLGDENLLSVFHHGTKEERLAAFLEGFRITDERIDAAYTRGEAFVKQLKPELDLSQESHSNSLNVYFFLVNHENGTRGLMLTRFPPDDSVVGRAGMEMGDEIVAVKSKPITSTVDCDFLRGLVKLDVKDVRTGTTHALELELP